MSHIVLFTSFWVSTRHSLSLSLFFSPKKIKSFAWTKIPTENSSIEIHSKTIFGKKKKKKKIWSVPPKNSDSNKVFSFWVGLELCMIWFFWFFYVGGIGSCKDIVLTWSLLSIISMFDTYVWCTCIMVTFEFQFIMLIISSSIGSLRLFEKERL